MAGRGWDGEGWAPQQRRLPGPGPRRAAGRKPFGATWWGAAWIDAIEHRASLDPNRLPRGRTYARSGQVDQVEIERGALQCLVQGSRPEPYKVRIRVRTFTNSEWVRVLDALGAQAGHVAALFDGELPAEVADDVRRIGLDLLPGPGEVQPRCSCPDWADPCKHAAAVCYLLADELDRDPFLLLLLRGRDREQVLAALRSRRRVGQRTPRLEVPSGPEGDPGVAATAAWARTTGPLPRLPRPPRLPARPAVLAADPPPGAGISAAALRSLAADAAARAWGLAVGARTTPSDATLGQDLARRAAALLAGPEGAGPAAADETLGLGELARRAGVPARQLLRQALAWHHGGPQGLAVLVDGWDPPAEAVAAGRTLLGDPAVARRNRLTAGSRQLRLGRDGRWYPFRRAASGWDPDGPPLDAGPANLNRSRTRS